MPLSSAFNAAKPRWLCTNLLFGLTWPVLILCKLHCGNEIGHATQSSFMQLHLHYPVLHLYTKRKRLAAENHLASVAVVQTFALHLSRHTQVFPFPFSLLHAVFL